MFLTWDWPRLGTPALLTVPFGERLRQLAAGERRIAYYFDPKTCAYRYRVLNMIGSLAGDNSDASKNVSASWFVPNDGDMSSVLDNADALVLCHTPYDANLAEMIENAKRRSLPVFYDIDDLVFDTHYVPLILQSLQHNYRDDAILDYWFAQFGRHGAALKRCDCVIVTNPFLAKLAQEFAPRLRCAVIPNFLNGAQQVVSRWVFARKWAKSFARDRQLHIGYFSGTATHNRDFAVVAPIIAKLLKEDNRLVLRIVGPLDVGPELESYDGRIERFPLQNFLNLQHLIGQTEINIAPLLDNAFTQCKSELKFFEAAIVGTITIATPTVPFRSAIADKVTGLLAADDEWESKLRQALSLIDSPDDHMSMAKAAFLHVQKNYGYDRFGTLITQTIFPDTTPTYRRSPTGSLAEVASLDER